MRNKTNAPTFMHGWNPDLQDVRDYGYAQKEEIFFENVVDLRSIMPPVVNQGVSGSSTAQAITALLMALHIKRDEIYLDRSRLFLYYNARAMRNAQKCDCGAMLRDVLKSITKIGACSEELLQYDPALFADKPSETCYEDATLFQSIEYYRLSTAGDMLECLREGYPFAIGFVAYDDFVSARVARTALLPLPTAHSRMIGGHAVLVVGFDRKKQLFLVRNSWGDKWGDGGYFWMPYEYLAFSEYANSAWTIRFPD